MKFEKLFYVIVSTILITAFILIGYVSSPLNSRNPEGPVKKIYFVDHISIAHQKVIDLFNQKYKGQIQVVAINTPFEKFSTNERKELLARYLRSKSERIDVLAVDQIWVPRFAKWCIPLDKLITQKQKDNLLPQALESSIYKNTLVAIPIYIDIAVMFYRKDLLMELPDFKIWQKKLSESITWEDFILLNQRLKKQNPFFLFPADDYEGLICSFAEMMAEQNKSIVEYNKLNLISPEAVKSLQLLVDLVNKYGVSPKQVCEFKENPSYDYFVENNGIFLRGWASFEVNYKDKFKSPNATIEKAPTPHFAGGKVTSVFGGWNLMISKYSTKVSESMTFINFIQSKEAQKIMYEVGGYLPINNEIYSDSAYINKHNELKFYKTLLQHGFHRPFLENYTNISDILSYYLNLAMQQKITVKDALTKAEEKINQTSNF
ncbi:MAG: extracellular solute-binding protein [Ignavibacteriales bacterium]|nr:extracellular solute-binding protein [Ignavibacteriales bacterium]